MAKLRIEKTTVAIRDVILHAGRRELPVVAEDSDLEDVIETLRKFSHSRLVYVVDENRTLVGTISLGTVVRHIFSPSHEPRVHPKSLLSMITTEHARDIMNKHPISATEEDDVDVVMKRMVGKNVKEIAVVDAEGRLLADVTMIDLLAYRR